MPRSDSFSGSFLPTEFDPILEKNAPSETSGDGSHHSASEDILKARPGGQQGLLVTAGHMISKASKTVASALFSPFHLAVLSFSYYLLAVEMVVCAMLNQLGRETPDQRQAEKLQKEMKKLARQTHRLRDRNQDLARKMEQVSLENKQLHAVITQMEEEMHASCLGAGGVTREASTLARLPDRSSKSVSGSSKGAAMHASVAVASVCLCWILNYSSFTDLRGSMLKAALACLAAVLGMYFVSLKAQKQWAKGLAVCLSWAVVAFVSWTAYHRLGPQIFPQLSSVLRNPLVELLAPEGQ
mmetsp:Transcript_180/g.624  ORF Transcript_180/g.624 Transcript_180/m.624 type:complete len:298 (-) Transcript_180:258-1151(-)|eukprot:CAMPEP_0117680282 /NCGR_PEP_ID=MMETSP0804-20121206/18266_1 /TAXON_ID=1074897 /ORGANISM="Tetraselmis astigmatica, Strain CCMP880" /LENGTH=297 /DNA_ID=CAMNT_0005489763 /DNA_START=99 /DNA_END=992 /DNA_ORIENTATION=+